MVTFIINQSAHENDIFLYLHHCRADFLQHPILIIPRPCKTASTHWRKSFHKHISPAWVSLWNPFKYTMPNCGLPALHQNWQLADFETGEIKEALEDYTCILCRPCPKCKQLPMIVPAIDSISKAISCKERCNNLQPVLCC